MEFGFYANAATTHFAVGQESTGNSEDVMLPSLFGATDWHVVPAKPSGQRQRAQFFGST